MANQKIIEKISIQSAEILIDIGSVNFNVKKRFKLTSGKLSPVYCDCRRIISFPSERKKLINFLIKKLKNKDYFKSINNISGGETAGIPFASFVSSKLNLPMTYIRKQKKEFGRKEQIEGIIKEKDEVLLIEDLITDGGSKWDFLKAVKEKKANTRAIAVIFNYGLYENFITYKKKKIDLISLTNWKYILYVAKKKEILSKKDINYIQNFLTSLGIKN